MSATAAAGGHGSRALALAALDESATWLNESLAHRKVADDPRTADLHRRLAALHSEIRNLDNA